MVIATSMGGPLGDGGAEYPVSPQNNWAEVHADVTAEDNEGNRIVDPADSGFDDLWIPVRSGTTLVLSLVHQSEGAVTGPNANVFGRDAEGKIAALADADGNIDIAIAGDQTNDVHQDATPNKRTVAMPQVDMLGHSEVLVCVKDAASAVTTFTSGTIEGKVI